MASHKTSLIRGTGIVSGLTLVSRCLGFVRDLLVAQLFGAGMAADAFFVAFRIPNLLRSIFAEGALTSAFVPVFSSELTRGKAEARRALASVTGMLILGTGALSILGIVFSWFVVDLFAPGFGTDPQKEELCITLTQLMFPYIIFVSLVAAINGALNSIKIFGASAFAQVVMNIVLILGALLAGLYQEREAALVLALSVVVGGVVQVVVQLPALRRGELAVWPSLKVLSAPAREVLKLMAPAIIGATVYQLIIFINTLLASVLEPGSVSWLFYADRLAQLPIGVFSIALASVLLPALSQSKALGDNETFSKNLIDALRYTSFVIIPLAALIFCLAEPTIIVLFERGAFDRYASQKTAQSLQAFALGLWGTSCHAMAIRGFIARKDTVTPTLVGGITLILTVISSLLLMGPVVSATDDNSVRLIQNLQHSLSFLPQINLGHTGLALSSALTSTISFTLVSLLLARRRDGLKWRSFVVSTNQSLFAALGSAAAVLALQPLIPTNPVIQLLILGPGGLAVYLFLSWLQKSTELKETFSSISRFIRK